MPAIERSSAGDSPLDEQLQTIAAYIGLGALLLTAGALLNQRHLRIRDNDPGRDAADPAKVGIFRAEAPSYFQVVRGRRTILPSVPTLEDLIRAGDLGLWTSTTLNCIQACPGRPGWVPLMESIVCSIALAEQSARGRPSGLILTPEMQHILDRCKELLSPEHPLVSRLRFYRGSKPKLIKCVRKFDISEPNPRNQGTSPPPNDGPTRQGTPLSEASTSIPLTPLPTTATSTPTTSTPLTIQTTPIWLLNSQLCVPTSSVETLTLAAVLGIPLSINDFTQHVHGTGPVNSSLSINPSQSIISLSIGQAHSTSTFRPNLQGSGSGYTTTMAKHIAFGCIPFAENHDWVRAVYVTDDVLQAVKEGRSIKDFWQGYAGASMEYLWELPAAKEVDAMYDCDGGWEETNECLGVFKTARGGPMEVKKRLGSGKTRVMATWQRAVAGIAFGGLVPQGSSLLVEAVQFTVGGTNLGGCINELENLMDDLHQIDTGSDEEKLELHGDLVHDRCRLRDSVTGFDVSRPTRWGTARATAIFFRYMTLLELVAARCDPGEHLRGAHGGLSGDPEVRGEAIVDRIFQESVALMDEVYAAAVITHLAQNPVEGSPRGEPSETARSLLNADLGAALTELRFRVNRNKDRIALSDCAIVVRCILAAWACQVPVMPWNDEEIIDLELGPLSTSTFPPRTRRLVVLADLPQIAGLG